MVNFSVLEPFEHSVDQERLNLTVVKTLQNQEIDPEGVDLSIVIAGNVELQDLNRQYSGIDAPTDVLSFTLDEKDPETGRLYLGDVIISFQKALEQAENAGHPVISELQLLTVHGILHLLGHDHAEDGPKSKMWAAQRRILEELNVDLKKWPEE
ncbi:MAG TPA: rRNA maturation RNase YbeY [Anaerolineaceae bacterium]|nr:rRNA maturation RNase YbeY [Anaerolineaceae bacterium]